MFSTKLHYLAFASTHSTGNFETIMFTIILIIKINKSVENEAQLSTMLLLF